MERGGTIYLAPKFHVPHAVPFAFMHVKELVDEDFTYTTTVYQLTPPFALDV